MSRYAPVLVHDDVESDFRTARGTSLIGWLRISLQNQFGIETHVTRSGSSSVLRGRSCSAPIDVQLPHGRNHRRSWERARRLLHDSFCGTGSMPLILRRMTAYEENLAPRGSPLKVVAFSTVIEPNHVMVSRNFGRFHMVARGRTLPRMQPDRSASPAILLAHELAHIHQSASEQDAVAVANGARRALDLPVRHSSASLSTFYYPDETRPTAIYNWTAGR